MRQLCAKSVAKSVHSDPFFPYPSGVLNVGLDQHPYKSSGNRPLPLFNLELSKNGTRKESAELFWGRTAHVQSP
jgi:hypothetical protein